MQVLRSTPLRPLAARARKLSTSASGIDVMTAFVSRDALLDTLAPAVERGAVLRFLTGTFGNVTRAKTFKQLHRLGQKPNATVRVWDCGTHRNLHAKLYIWRRADGTATVWVGSANLTDGGLQNEGEVMLELALPAGDPSLTAVAAAYDREWERGEELSQRFLEEYRESPRDAHLLRVLRRQRGRRPPARKGKAQRMFVMTASAHYSDEGAVVARVDELLGGTAQYWYRGRSKLLEQVRTGDWCLYIDTVDGDAEVVAVTDVARDGKHVVFAFEELWKWRPFAPGLRDRLGALGLRRSRDAIAAQWVPAERIFAVCHQMHPDANWAAEDGPG
jgi:HKD family nuclease